MELVLDRTTYAAEQDIPEELLDPIPQCAPANYGIAQLPYQLMMPTGDPRVFTANFHVDHVFSTDGLLVRYGALSPVWLPWKTGCVHTLDLDDILSVTLTTCGR